MDSNSNGNGDDEISRQLRLAVAAIRRGKDEEAVVLVRLFNASPVKVYISSHVICRMLLIMIVLSCHFICSCA